METIIGILLAFPVVSTLVLMGDFKHYRPTYRALTSGRMHACMHLHLHIAGRTVRVTFFSEGNIHSITYPCATYHSNGTVGLLKGYIHDSLYTYMCPYSLYWMLKIRGVMKRMIEDSDPVEDRRRARISRIIG
jgi:hypothetical protein